MTRTSNGSPLDHDDIPIVAISTAIGIGSRASIRASGRDVLVGLAGRVEGEAASLLGDRRRGCTRGRWRLDDGSELPVIVFVAIGPASFTGEDVVELEVPGHPNVVGRVAAEIRDRLDLRLGDARFAGPGEFSARAFLNGRISIGEATSIAAGIAADRDADLDAVDRMRRTHAGRSLASLSKSLISVVARLEAAIDFTDEEDVVGCRVGELRSSLEPIRERLARLLESSEAAIAPAAHVPRIALVGRPNAGKSSLFNALLGTERVVTSPTAGTTRDVIEGEMDLRVDESAAGPTIRVRILDTAGIGSSLDTESDIDRSAALASRAAMSDADLVLACRAAGQEADRLFLDRPVLDVETKIDLLEGKDSGPLGTSSITGEGIDRLRNTIGRWAAERHRGSDAVVGWRSLVTTALEVTTEAIEDLEGLASDESPPHPETTAAGCRLAAEAVGRLEGEFDPEAVLDLVFGRFCIGK
ncbi:MAG: GTP-binding protein [Phycisphaera sp.]|nr:GTP-binding protein [Phycisphaera sp.]